MTSVGICFFCDFLWGPGPSVHVCLTLSPSLRLLSGFWNWSGCFATLTSFVSCTYQLLSVGHQFCLGLGPATYEPMWHQCSCLASELSLLYWNPWHHVIWWEILLHLTGALLAGSLCFASSPPVPSAFWAYTARLSTYAPPSPAFHSLTWGSWHSELKPWRFCKPGTNHTLLMEVQSRRHLLKTNNNKGSDVLRKPCCLEQQSLAL